MDKQDNGSLQKQEKWEKGEIHKANVQRQQAAQRRTPSSAAAAKSGTGFNNMDISDKGR